MVLILGLKAQGTKHVNPKANLEMFENIDQMPRFPGCEDMPSGYFQEKCAKRKLNKYINENLEYPALDKKVKTKVSVKFIVDKNSNILNVKIISDCKREYADAAKKVVESMNNMSEKWIPAKQGEKSVNIWHTIPVRFSL